MKILEKYEGNKTYMFPNGAIATPEVIEIEFPAVAVFTHVIETDEDGEVCFAVQNLSAMRTMYNIDKDLSDEEAIVQLQDLLNAPVPEEEPTAEERIASALEFQNLMAMPDEEE